jgi:hypothetical protein
MAIYDGRIKLGKDLIIVIASLHDALWTTRQAEI